MRSNQVKIRIIGFDENCERILSLLRCEAKQWGNRTLLRSRKFTRDGQARPYHRMFGNADTVIYVNMTLKET